MPLDNQAVRKLHFGARSKESIDMVLYSANQGIVFD